MFTLRPLTCDVSVANQLPRLAPRAGEAQTEGHVVQTPFQLLQQQLAGDAGRARSLLVVGAELPFQGEIDAARLLLLAQLQTVAYDLRLAVAAVLAGGKLRFSMAHLSLKHFAPFRNSFMPSRRHSRQTAPV